MTKQEDSGRRPGTSNDVVLNYMIKYGVPITRENYIAMAYGNTALEEWTPEHESMLPHELQDMDQFERKK